ncbi:MAG TPA: aminotransferase class V-fold PLP-dependent enzyme [Solirubrobacteraceae bacterium]|nr:aminotransferase class V-fold PLP-dependent enzyme [Solirubrobacteraceae bacterium]
MDAAELRSRFPVCARYAYLNSGTDGPIPAEAAAAATDAVREQTAAGRWGPNLDPRFGGLTELRAAYAGALGCAPERVALTTSTSEGLGRVLAGLGLGPGDEILTSDQEHPGLIGPLLAARARGARVRTAPLATLADAVAESTTVVACSHVGWIGGELADPRLADCGRPLILDGAQGVGAVGVDVEALNCAAYAGAGQKWLCGADGTGMLYVADWFEERLLPVMPAYLAFAEPNLGLDSRLHEDARRHDTAALPREAVAMSLAAAGVLGAFGWDAVHARGRELAARLAGELAERGRTVAPRGDTTLVSWEDPEPEAAVARLAAAGVVVRNLPNTPYVRASVGAFNDETDLDRLLEAL